MGRLTVCHVAIVAAVAASSCNAFKQAGSARSGAGGQQTGGVGGAGGTAGGGGIGGSGGGGAGGRGGTGGTTPLIIIDASATDGHVNPDANCGARSKTAMKVAPDILILLDRSGSMNDDVNNQMCLPDGGGMGMSMGCGAKSKWAQVTPAIMQVVSETQADVNWGLKFFPDNSANTCNVSTTAAVDVGPQNAAAIGTAIMGATSTNGGVDGLQRHAHAQRRDRRDDLSADADRHEPEDHPPRDGRAADLREQRCFGGRFGGARHPPSQRR